MKLTLILGLIVAAAVVFPQNADAGLVDTGPADILIALVQTLLSTIGQTPDMQHYLNEVVETFYSIIECLNRLRDALLALPKSDLTGLVKNKQAEECFANEPCQLNEFIDRFTYNELNGWMFDGQSFEIWADNLHIETTNARQDLCDWVDRLITCFIAVPAPV